MNHVDRLIPRYLHGQMTPEQRRTFQQHIAQCAACQAKLDASSHAESRLKSEFAAVGRADYARLARMMPKVMRAVHADLNALKMPHSVTRMARPASFEGGAVQFGAALLALALMFVFVSSTLARTTPAPQDIPNQAVPAEVGATWTPLITDDWLQDQSQRQTIVAYSSPDKLSKSIDLTAAALSINATPTRGMEASPAPIAQ